MITATSRETKLRKMHNTPFFGVKMHAKSMHKNTRHHRVCVGHWTVPTAPATQEERIGPLLGGVCSETVDRYGERLCPRHCAIRPCSARAVPFARSFSPFSSHSSRSGNKWTKWYTSGEHQSIISTVCILQHANTN